MDLKYVISPNLVFGIVELDLDIEFSHTILKYIAIDN